MSRTTGSAARTSTARAITSAALIMISVFASPILDVTLVRMMLVPAAISLLGHHVWWLPDWLEHRLPTIDIEGGAHDGEEQPVAEPADTEPEREPVPV